MAERLKTAGAKARAAKGKKAQQQENKAHVEATATQAIEAQAAFDFGVISKDKAALLDHKLKAIAAAKSKMEKARGDMGNAYKYIEEDLGLDRQGIKLAEKIAGMEEQARTAFLSSLFIGLKVREVPIDIAYGADAVAAAGKAGKVVAKAVDKKKAANGNGQNGPTDDDLWDAEEAGYKAAAKGKGTRPSCNPYVEEDDPLLYAAFDKGWDRQQAEAVKKMGSAAPASTLAH